MEISSFNWMRLRPILKHFPRFSKQSLFAHELLEGMKSIATKLPRFNNYGFIYLLKNGPVQAIVKGL